MQGMVVRRLRDLRTDEFSCAGRVSIGGFDVLLCGVDSLSISARQEKPFKASCCDPLFVRNAVVRADSIRDDDDMHLNLDQSGLSEK
jgi:hypothetical protein